MSTSAPHCAVVGRGRLGTALTAALRAGGVVVEDPLGRGETPTEAFSLHPLMTYHAAAALADGTRALAGARTGEAVAA